MGLVVSGVLEPTLLETPKDSCSYCLSLEWDCTKSRTRTNPMSDYSVTLALSLVLVAGTKSLWADWCRAHRSHVRFKHERISLQCSALPGSLSIYDLFLPSRSFCFPICKTAAIVSVCWVPRTLLQQGPQPLAIHRGHAGPWSVLSDSSLLL